jgi:hypothetical protein
LYNPNSPKIPLGTKKDVDELFRVAEMYSQFKDQQIVCLGRSPKWFLKTAQWMDGGIKKYKFSAFSGFWYRQDIFEPGNVVRSRVMEPTEEEVAAYRKYLKRLNLDPATYVRNYKQTGKRTVITDFIETGKGVTSYLEILARYALDQINSGKFNFTMEDFAKSFELFLIGNMENQEKFYLDDSSCMSEPRVVFPEELWPYEKYIKQDFREIKEYSLFEDILMNENTTECRSTYYPHQMWTVYDPDRFKVGMPSKTMKKKEILDYIRKEAVKLKKKDVVASFTPTMRDFRNLLTFKILDELAKAKRLK